MMTSAPLASVTNRGRRAAVYEMFGQRILSEFELPIAPAPSSPGGPPAWTFRRGKGHGTPPAASRLVAELRCHPECDVVLRRHDDGHGTWLWNRAIATCHIASETRSVDVYTEPGCDDRALGLLLAGQVAVHVLHRLGLPSLHASAVLTARGAIAFLGAKGQGKSTMAMYFLSRGAALLTDDALALDASGRRIHALPGPPMMKVWPETAVSLLANRDLPSLLENYEKKLYRLDGDHKSVTRAVPVARVYLLERYQRGAGPSAADVVPLNRREALTTLLAHTSNATLLSVAEVARILPLYARFTAETPVRVLRYPNGFEHQQVVYSEIDRDLGS
jgi:hypothetical protein